MNFLCRMTLAGVLTGIAACGAEPPGGANSAPSYRVLDEHLESFREDFNAAAGRVRLVFIVGPSCGFCLRGMADMNDTFLHAAQTDPRLQTFVLHVPILGATEEHVARSIPLLEGPRILHYWDAAGHSGLQYQKALQIDMYAWDVWMIYDPGVIWEKDAAPPAPLFWQHQLGGLDRSSRLDPQEFAAVVDRQLAQLPPARRSSATAGTGEKADSEIIPVAQPRGVMIEQHIQGRGNYARLKSIESIRYQGTTTFGGRSHALTIVTRRPDFYRREVILAKGVSTAGFEDRRTLYDGPDGQGLPRGFQDQILRAFDFDGWLVDWKIKGNDIRPLGMQKTGDRLPWVMEAELADGQTWRVYLDSKTGSILRTVLAGDSDEAIALEYEDFSDVHGFRLPHTIVYLLDGRRLAVDRFEKIDVDMDPAAKTPM